MLFFEKRVGHVVALEDANVDGSVRLLSFQDENAGLSFQTHLSVITSVGFSRRENKQFANSIGRTIYLYVFGEQPGQIQIDGLSFMKNCERAGETQHGIEKLNEWYEDNRLSQRRQPLRLTIGAKGLDAFLHGIDYRINDGVSFTASWTLHLDAMPELK